MATLGKWFLLMGVICLVISLATVGNLNVSVTFFSNTFTSTDSVSTEKSKLKQVSRESK
jgi:hypothetical protein